MYLRDITKEMTYWCRIYKGKPGDYIVYCSFYNNMLYWDSDKKTTSEVRSVSSIWEHGDFVECDEHGKLKQEIKEQEMENNVNYIGGDYKVVQVRYLNGGIYNFKADVSLALEEDSLVVVEAKNGLGLANVISIFENHIDNAAEVKKATAWVVSVVDTSAQDQRKEATRQRAYIIQQLDEKKSQMESISVYALLAKTDPQAAKLLEQLGELGK